MNDELSDSENDDPEEANNSAIRIDDWISFQSGNFFDFFFHFEKNYNYNNTSNLV